MAKRDPKMATKTSGKAKRTKAPRNPDHYRPAAGIALFNREGQLWMGRRAGAKGKYVWQLPQGGIDPDEDPEYAAIRELHEETGISIAHLLPLGHIDDWLYYDIPGGLKRGAVGWRGQRQRWYAFRFIGKPEHINLNFHLPAEFTQYRWGTLSEAAKLIVPFKREVYDRLARDFAQFERPHGA